MLQSRIRIKICGITRREDVDQAFRLGADAFGLIFHPESSRYVSMEMADKLLESLPPFITAVAVLVNPEADFVRELLRRYPFLTLQFHGAEPAAFCDQFNAPYIKAFPARSHAYILEMEKAYPHASALLLDSFDGGSGKCFDWKLIPENIQKPWILAGGLNAENIQKALKYCRPWALDIASSVESAPGIKDFNKMHAFIEASQKT